MNKSKLIFIISIIVLFICGIMVIYYNYNNETEEIIIKKEEKETVNEEEKVEEFKEKVYYYVDIKGAVNNPNVYKLEENSRVIDVINMAGGLKENADTSIINLSKKITDEMFIVIYTKDELQKYKEQTISTSEIQKKIEEEIVSVDKNNDAIIETTQEDTSEENKLININTATKEELLNISGIGENKADSIIKYREENGSFKIVDDIKNVSGIGDSLFEKIKEYITV